MANPYKPNDKVFIKIKGVEVEAAIRLVWKDEVQVRVTSGGLVWRTVRTVRAAATPVVEPPAPPIVDVALESVSEAVPPHSEEAAAVNEPSVETGTMAGNTGAIESAEPAQPTASIIEHAACGVHEAYVRGAMVICRPLDEYETHTHAKIVVLPTAAINRPNVALKSRG